AAPICCLAVKGVEQRSDRSAAATPVRTLLFIRTALLATLRWRKRDSNSQSSCLRYGNAAGGAKDHRLASVLVKKNRLATRSSQYIYIHSINQENNPVYPV